MTKENLTKEKRENILKARQLLFDNFIWGDTKEGYDYWFKVDKALERIAKSKQYCKCCGRELEDE
ncbi:MAG: hypothetical protein ACOC1P_03115 [Minisyncoccales bacterium]